MCILTYFFHFAPVCLCPVLDGLLLLLCDAQLLPQLLQFLQQGRHLIGFVPGVFLHPAQPAQLAAHPLSLHGVGTLQTDELLVDQLVVLVLRGRSKQNK